MFAGMDRSERDDGVLGRIAARRDEESDHVRDWLAGPGAMVLAVGAVIVVVVFVATVLGDLVGR